MFLAIAALLIQPQLLPHAAFSAEKAAVVQPANTDPKSSSEVTKNSLPTAEATVAAPDQPEAEVASADLPDAPTPVVSSPAPVAFLKAGKSMAVSVKSLREENRRKELLWKGLVIASAGAATFDAWSTRHAITTAGAQELNPMLRPFAGNASLYAVIQVAPALMDYVGKRMMYSRHPWARRMWWVPQSASFVSSVFCGAHNLTVP